MRVALAALLVAAGVASGAVEGIVINRTTGKPQPGATVTLYKLGDAGMEAVESVKSEAGGRFRIEQTPQGPHLIQTAFDGVTYNHMLPPGAPTTGLQLEVYHSSANPGAAKVTQHMVLLEPAEGRVAVTETLIFENHGKLSYNDPDRGTLRLWLPTGVKARVMATAPAGMPIERAAAPAGRPNVYKVDFPIKPGETRFDVTYTVPLSEGGEFRGKVLHNGTVRLVTPAGVTLSGNGIELVGREPRTQAAIYSIQGSEYAVRVEGRGALRAAADDSEDSGPGIQQILPRIYDRAPWIVGLALGALMAGFVLLYRRSTAAAASPPPRQGARRG
ncbi:MAG: carboxypeptidase-like regulatory domain-containing protein [Bryobacterales bacterium]|nr:carboxypeptidase-like regulatory domain-containing protein [Bryobacteraceae bacterium]MDW8352912.1 carboxypeptidase-like regulatory domain-containing protein [Bryobacterales bacterium]